MFRSQRRHWFNDAPSSPRLKSSRAKAQNTGRAWHRLATDVSSLSNSAEPVQRQPMEEEEEMMQAKTEAVGDSSASTSVSMDSLRGRGTPLSSDTRNYFEPRFGQDFSDVRIHTGSEAEHSASSIQAKAFTSGSDIVFGKNRHDPHSADGKKLLAHELTHVVQQTDGLVQPQIQRDEDEEDESGFDYNIIPPSLSYRYGPFSAGATTSAAQLGYRGNYGTYGLGYQYGSDIFATGQFGDLSTRFGVNPGSGALSMSGSYGGFNLGAGVNPGSGAFNAGLSYGAPLLPMPMVLGEQAGAAWQGAMGVGGVIPGFMEDPLGTYDAQSGNIDALSTFGGSLGRIYDQQEQGGLQFGFGANLAYDPTTGVIFYTGLQGQW